MSTFIEYLLLFLVIWTYGKVSWSLYFYLGVKFSKRFADIFDFCTTVAMCVWLFYSSHLIIAGFFVFLWLITNFNKEFQEKLSKKLDAMRMGLDKDSNKE